MSLLKGSNSNGITQEDYVEIRGKEDKAIIILEGDLKKLNDGGRLSIDVNGILYGAMETFKKLDLLYLNADIEGKREIIRSIFPKKLVFENGNYRTPEMSIAASLIHQINSQLRRKKSGLTSKKLELSAFVHPIESNPNRLLEDLTLIAAFEQFDYNPAG